MFKSLNGIHSAFIDWDTEYLLLDTILCGLLNYFYKVS